MSDEEVSLHHNTTQHNTHTHTFIFRVLRKTREPNKRLLFFLRKHKPTLSVTNALRRGELLELETCTVVGLHKEEATRYSLKAEKRGLTRRASTELTGADLNLRISMNAMVT